jgi:hypothetical protein
MTDERTFTNVDDAVLIRQIKAAQRKIVFVAPGVHKPVADALATRLHDSTHLEIAVILDIDPEVYRLGYGHIDGLTTLKTACEKRGTLLLHQPGIRIGLLIADDLTLIYSPTPLLIEAGSKQPDKPNAIRLETTAIFKVAAACTAGGDDQSPEIGLDPAKAPDIEAVKKDLEVNPPQPFDVSRAVRVFNSRIQYVEFTFVGYKLSLREALIPPEFLGLADDPQMADRWHNTFRPFKDSEAFRLEYTYTDDNGFERDEWVTERSLEKEKHAIKKKYLKDIPSHGTVIRRTDVDAFDQVIGRLRGKTEAFKQLVSSEIEKVAQSSARNLAADLWPKVCNRDLPFSGWKGAGDAERRKILMTEIANTLSNAVEAYAPVIKTVYKAVDYSSIRDPAFQEILAELFGDESKGFFPNFDAAPATSPVRK